MKGDIVERLSSVPNHPDGKICREAAQEIEALRGLLREAREDTHLIAMTEPHHCVDARYTGERIREAGDRLSRIDSKLSEG